MTSRSSPAPIGDNNPPEPTQLEAAQADAENVRTEALNWLDGAVVSNQAEADAVAKLVDMARKGKARADASREDQKRPHLEAGRTIDAAFKPVLADFDRIADVGKAALQPFLVAKDARQRAEALAAQERAASAYEDARDAFKAAPATDLHARELAEAKLEAARAATWDAKDADKARAHAKGGTRAIGLRISWHPELTDRREAMTHFWNTEPDAIMVYVQSLAERAVNRGARAIPGFNVVERKVAA